MKKKELLAMRPLNATSKMVAIAKKDKPRKETIRTYYYTYERTRRTYYVYLRCRVENDILKVALYYPDNLRAGGRLPSYEVYIDHVDRRFMTYDCLNDKWLTAKVDRLKWPVEIPYDFGTWMSDRDAKMAAEYLGTKELGYDAILSYQKELREEALERHHKKVTDPWDADMALTPALPKDWEHWVDKVGIPQNFMFYRYKKRGAKTGFCTYCGKDVPLRETPHHNKEGRCPCCGHEVTYKSLGRLGRYLSTDEVCVYLLQNRPDGFTVREFWARRHYTRETYQEPEIYCTEHWRTIYDAQMARRTYFWGWYRQDCIRWVAGMPACSYMGHNNIYSSHGCQPGRVYGKTLPHLAKDRLKQTGLAEWIYLHNFVIDPDKYMIIREKIPQFEQIWKAGLTELTEECWHNYGCMYGLIKEPQSTSLTKALGLSRQSLARLRRYNGGTGFLRWLQFEKESGKPIPDESIRWLCAEKISHTNLDFILNRMNVVQICNYLRRQAVDSDEPVWQVLTTWRDYLSMAERLGMDTGDEIVYRVKLLKQRHDELVVRCQQKDQEHQAKEVLEQFPNVDKICQSIKSKYEYANEQYAITAPNGALDIIVEGAVLCHCVGSSDRYWDRIERREAYILFLRRVSAPDLPYYTLEVEPDGTVRQKRTRFDRQENDIEDAKKFLLEWQRVVAKRLTAGDRKKASVSRVLREQEFEQLERDNVIVHIDDLGNRRLVDVLTADLMENAA